MSTRFRLRQSYPVDPAALIELYGDPRFHEHKERGLGATEVSSTREDGPGDQVVIRVTSSRPAVWDGNDRSTFTLRFCPRTGAGTWERVQHGFEDRAGAHGRSRIVARDGGGSEVEVEGELEIRVPLVGRWIEKRIVTSLDAQSRREAEIVRERLGLA